MSTRMHDVELKLVKYSSGNEEERAAQIPGAIDYWNTEIHYWDRRNKQAKMMASPYSFYRGTDQLYWYDFGQDSRLAQFGNEHTVTWLSGDYHAYNAGSFAQGGDKGVLIVYGLNDFDESVIADYQLDLWRLAVSVVLIARSNDNLADKDLNHVIDALCAKYLERMRQLAQNKPLVAETISQQNAYGKLKHFLEIVQANYTREKMLDKWAPVRAGQDGVGARRFDLSLEKLGSTTVQEKQKLTDAMYAYLETTTLKEPANNFKVLDIARRLLAGTGSLGMDRYYVLLQDDAANVVRIIDVKQQCLPSPYPYMGASAQELFLKHGGDNAAKAVVVATRSMSAHPDPFLGYLQLGEKVYSVQERNPYKGSYPALLEEATKKFKKLGLESKKEYTHLAEQWALLLASHHAYARRGDEKESLEKNIMELVGDQDDHFQALVRTIASEYADQVERDWKSFKNNLGADVTELEA